MRRGLLPVAGVLRAARWLPPAACCLLLVACGPKLRPLTLPSGAGAPFPEFASVYAHATGQCRGVKTISLAMNLSGRAGRTKLRGRIDAGFAAPAGLRLEGVAPFGRPVFVVVARDGEATLVLPREDRVLRGAPPAAIVEALAGVPLDPADMRSAVSGCGFGSVEATAGTAYDNGWAGIASGDVTTFVRQIDGVWRVAAAVRGPLTIAYEYVSGRVETVRVRMAPATGPAAELALRLSQVEINAPLGRDVFEVEVPASAVPLTLDELRRAGPLGRQ